jgi:HAD superfamily hydrolase (TIGR01549 family)
VAPLGGVRAVLFDLDDTLFDHHRSARAAIGRVHAMHACFAGRGVDAFERAHARCLEKFHARVVAGEMSVEEARLARFRELFATAGVEPSGAQLDATAAAYRETYVAARLPIAGALRLLEALKPHVKIGIVSNNAVREQQEKVRHCGFGEHVDALVISEEVGVAKPDPAIFAAALARLRVAPHEAVMIGDSWPMDIEGARGAGIRPIWFNRTGRPRPAPARDVGELRALSPLEPVLTAIFGDARQRAFPCALA